MSNILIEENIMVSMRDGVQLATDIYRLEDTPPTPVLAVHTPYNKNGLAGGGDIFDVFRAGQVEWVGSISCHVPIAWRRPR